MVVEIISIIPDSSFSSTMLFDKKHLKVGLVVALVVGLSVGVITQKSRKDESSISSASRVLSGEFCSLCC